MAKKGSGDNERDATIERLQRELREALARTEAAEARLADQSSRLMALGSGREESMRALSETRAELERTARERDELQKRLIAVEGMQTETVALTEEEQQEEPVIHSALPSIDDLMANLNDMLQQSTTRGARLSGQTTEQPETEWHEMLAPEVMAPEGVDGEGEDGEERPTPKRRAQDARANHLLVFMDAAHPIKYPLYKGVMTIGRSENADIQIDGHFISRIHARIVCTPNSVLIEDAGSKNGIKVNSEIIERRDLHHGDVIGIGKLRFTFVEVGAGNLEPTPRSGAE
jgi:hypothetical protein